MAIDKKALLKRIGDKRGFRFGIHDFLAQVNPEYLSKRNEWIEYIYLTPKHLDRKTKELIIIAVCTAKMDIPAHIQVHIGAAVAAGATKEEIMETILVAANWSGGGMSGLEAWRKTFTPDLPSVMEPVDIK